MINNTTKSSNKIAQTINAIEHSNVLNELKSIARWMPYREINYDVKPIDPESGNIVHLEDTSNWRTFQEAKKAAKLVNADGLGFIFGDEYFCITLNGDFSNFYDESSWVMSQFKQFLNSYTEWSDNGRLNVFCRVQEYDSKTSLGSSLHIREGSIHANNMNKYCLVPVSGTSYGNPVPIADLTGKVTYLHELFALSCKDSRNCLQITYSDFRSAFKEAAEIFIFMCDKKGITIIFENNEIHLEEVGLNIELEKPFRHKRDKEFLEFMYSLLNASRYFQAAIIRELCDESSGYEYHFNSRRSRYISNFNEVSNSLCKKHLPCYPYDVALAIIFGVDKYQLYC